MANAAGTPVMVQMVPNKCVESPLSIQFTCDTTGTLAILAASATRNFHILGYYLYSDTLNNIAEFQAGSTKLNGPYKMVAGGGIVIPKSIGDTSWHCVPAGSALNLVVTMAGGTIQGCVIVQKEAVP